MKKPSDVGKLQTKLQRLNQKLRDVESQTTRISAAAVKLANGIQLLARQSSDFRDLK